MIKTLTLCQTCETNEATHKRVMFGDVHCADCIIRELSGSFEPINEEAI